MKLRTLIMDKRTNDSALSFGVSAEYENKDMREIQTTIDSVKEANSIKIVIGPDYSGRDVIDFGDTNRTAIYQRLNEIMSEY